MEVAGSALFGWGSRRPSVTRDFALLQAGEVKPSPHSVQQQLIL